MLVHEHTMKCCQQIDKSSYQVVANCSPKKKKCKGMAVAIDTPQKCTVSMIVKVCFCWRIGHVAASKYVVHYNTKVNGTYKNTGKKQSMTGIGIVGPG